MMKGEIAEGLRIAIKQVETIQAALTAPATTNDGLSTAAQTLKHRLRATLLTLESEKPLEAPTVLAVVEDAWLYRSGDGHYRLGILVESLGDWPAEQRVTVTITERHDA